MRVAIIDVGSNTARLLVAARGLRSVTPIHEERTLLALGEEVERLGAISELKLAETAERARVYARKARELGCRSVDVIVTAPGRQSGNAQELLRSLERATGIAPRVLSADEEGRLAYEGALAGARDIPSRVAVCDVGGGSTEVVVGTRSGGPDFCRSLDLGSLRLARRFLEDDPPRRKALAAARREVAERLADLGAPPAKAALATGGSARALRKVTGGRKLGERELKAAVELASTRTSVELAREFGLDPMRARTLLAGALILSETQRRLGVPLEVARGGLREGAALTLLTELAAA
jgi:exopolyphosphatase/guanosine-5'-triphosphate,3'-diphosphate pyrophosphatase